MLKFFGIVNATIPSDKIFNVRALDGISGAAGLGQMIGSVQSIRIEPGGPIHNHSIVTLTDALAVQSALSTIDPTLNSSAMASMFIGAGTASLRLEGLVDGLRRQLFGVGVAGTPAEDRAVLHENLAAVDSSIPYRALLSNPQAGGGFVQIVPVDAARGASIASSGKTDFGNFLALRTLTPFALQAQPGVAGAQAALDVIWASAHGGDFAEWTADKSARLYGDTTKEFAYTDTWYADRAAMLTWELQRNAANTEAVRGAAAESYRFQDMALGKAFTVVGGLQAGGNVAAGSNPALVLFGSDAGETLAGGGAAIGDHVYGMAGADTINGNGGNDYLEGNAGSDTLNGGDGNDTLLGGADADFIYGDALDDKLYGGQGADTLDGGNGRDELYGGSEADFLRGQAGADTLDGGSGNDILTGGTDGDVLRGGAGVDSYVLVSGDGNDTIDDVDGLGEIRIGATKLIGGSGEFAGIWKQSVNGKDVTYTFTPGADGRGDLLVRSEVGTTTVKHFQSGDLGIVLNAPAPNGINYSSPIDLVMGTTLDDNRSSTGGRHAVLGAGGNDRVQGLAGRDEVDGKAGDDIVEGGTGIDVVTGNDGNDTMFADSLLTEAALRDYIKTSATALTDGAMPAKLYVSTSEWLQGGLGSDTVAGGDGNDIIFGGGGKDLLVGGAGHDLINGDDDYEPGDLTTMYVQPATGAGAPFNAWYSSVIPHSSALDVGAADEIHAGSGDDAVYGELGDDTIWGDDGNDTMSGGEDDDVLFGGNGDDRLAGDDYGQLIGITSATPIGADFIDGGSGNDRIFGDGGADTLLGGAGNDVIRGNNDIAVGGVSPTAADDGDDYISGGDGNDTLAGDAAKDTILGGDGDDLLFGDSDQTPTANQGDDYLDGGAGADYLRGYGGNDTLLGGAGSDQFLGEAGDDFIDMGRDGGDPEDSNIASGGDGNDVIVGDFGQLNDFLGDAGDDELKGDGHLWGGDGNDTLLTHGYCGNFSQQTLLQGGNGNDVLSAPFGGASLYGEAGDDILSGGTGVTYMSGGTGNDAIQGGGGIDYGWGDEGVDAISGGAGPDQLAGGAGNDLLFGDSGDDLLFGEDGDDTLSGGSGRNYLVGGAGNDTYLIDAQSDGDVIFDSGGSNVAQFAAGVTSAQLTFRIGVDQFGNGRSLVVDGFASGRSLVVMGGLDGTISAYKFDDGSTLTSQQARDLALAAAGPAKKMPTQTLGVTGSSGNDTIDGSAAQQQVNAGSGNDTLIGGKFDDMLGGEAGDDRLTGGGGKNQLSGGDGMDTYVLGLEDGGTTIAESHASVTPQSELDTIEFGTGVLPGETRLIRDDADLVVAMKNGAVQSRIVGYFVATVPTLTGTAFVDQKIERFQFVDGTVWNSAQIATRIEAGTVNAMTGTTGNDTFVVDDGQDTVAELPNGGNDTIRSSVSFGLPGNVETLILTGVLDANAWANASNATSYLVGNDGNNIFDGPGGPLHSATGGGTGGYAVMSGGKGNDTYYYDYFKGGVAVENPNEGNDTVILTHGAGTFTLPGNIENAIDVGGSLNRGTIGTDSMIGNALDNFLGYAGPLSSSVPYYLDGGPGADTLQGASSNDVYVVDNANDRVIEPGNPDVGRSQYSFDEIRSSVTYELPDNVEVLTLTGSAAIDGIGNELGNRLDATQNIAGNTLHGGMGDDYYVVNGNDSVFESPGEGVDTIEFRGTGTRLYSAIDLAANVENLTLGDDLGASDLQGNSGDNVLTGNASDNLISGGGGDDSLNGGAGDDALDGGSGNDRLAGMSGMDTYRFSRGFGTDVIQDLDGASHIVFDATISHDDIRFDRGMLNVLGTGDRIQLAEYRDDVPGSLSTVSMYADAEVAFASGAAISAIELRSRLVASFSHVPTDSADGLEGTANDDRLFALGGDDVINGYAGNDSLGGEAGNDRIWGGAGADAIRGGDGDDLLFGEAGDDAITADTGADTVHGDDGNDAIDGGSESDTLFGDAGNDILRGGADSDHVYGGDGNDLLFAENDLSTSVANILSGENGDDTLIGGGGNDTLSGGDGNDTVGGNDGDDTLDGGQGNDLLQGGDGADYLYDVGGNDALEGGAGDDLLFGGDGDDVLDGGAGNDTLSGGSGTDTYVLNTGGGHDVVTQDEILFTSDKLIIQVGAGLRPADVSVAREDDDYSANLVVSINGGADSLRVPGYVDANRTVEIHFGDGTVWDGPVVLDKLYAVRGTTGNDVLTAGPYGSRLYGYAGNDTLDGGAGYDLLDGGAGADRMAGNGGVDTYIVDDPGDLVIGASPGYDTVNSAISYVLPANVDALLLTGSSALNGTGNALSNKLTGNAADNVLDGKAGADSMTGGIGNDTYVVDSNGDVVTELANEGTDTVQSSVTYTLAGTLENLTLTGSAAINGTGNGGSNVLTGNAGANILAGNAGDDQLNGGAGADTLKGGQGNDTYVVDTTGDVIVENAGEGTDAVQSSATYTLSSNVEILTLTGAAAINATGNTMNNVLTGNAGNNVLSGGAGADTLRGGVGDDTYVVDNAGDLVTEAAGEGTDIVQSSISHVLAANVENLTLTGTTAINATGNALGNRLTGNAGNNVLDGGAGSDTLAGGAGNDSYIVDVATDVVIEAVGEGTDTEQSAVTLTLAANVENLTLTGVASINGTGNTLDNVLNGNGGDNVLSGGSGSDTMQGGAGNDTYIVDVGTDVVVEAAGSGIDSVQSAATIALFANVEYVTLSGAAAINATGNLLDNWVQGNSAANTLDGGNGNDTVWGASGDDSLLGGAGNDLLQGGMGNDTLTDASGNNLLDGGIGMDTLTGGAAREMLIGGAGSDTLTTGGGSDVIGFNKGDGADIVNASTGTDDTLSLGGGLAYADLKLKKTGLDLILDAGNGDQITLRNWYQSGVNNKSVLNLQVIADAMSAFNPAGSDPLLKRKVVNFNFTGIVSAFDAAIAANPTITSWNLSNALSGNYLSGSDIAALGGDFAYDFGHRNALTTMGATPAQSILASASFGSSAQALQAATTLYSGAVRLA
ncbi:MAG TPA: calcium-binding protein [Casimicrobiaceae bacterium]|nr:calcium-binding protein [Casimicrobiaceae bacterium]